MMRWLALLSLYISACAAVNVSCAWYPSPEYRDVCMECSGSTVDRVPLLLPKTLKMLLLTGTAIASLERDAFHGRDLPELTTLYVTGGRLTSVGANAFCALPALEMLYLDHNRLESLDEQSFNCSQFLRTVSLVDNPSLHVLPRLVSRSVESLYVDNCSLESIDVATVERMTALKELSITGNRDLLCPTVKTMFKKARPDLLVICEDSAGYRPSSVFPSDQERTSEKSFNESDSATSSTNKDSTGDEEGTSEKSLTQPNFTITKTKIHSTDDEQHTTQKSHNESDFTIKNKEDVSADTASNIPLTVGATAGVFVVVVIVIVVLYCVYRHRNSVPKSPSDDPSEQPWTTYP